MFILHDILEKLKNEFPRSRNGQERATWFIYTIVAIIVPFASSQDVLSPPVPQIPFRLYRDPEKTILHLHGIPKDSMETIVAGGLADDPPTADRGTATVGIG